MGDARWECDYRNPQGYHFQKYYSLLYFSCKVNDVVQFSLTITRRFWIINISNVNKFTQKVYLIKISLNIIFTISGFDYI
ncbi:hypothetical protein BSG33_03360 [Vibrio parahaemolyticus]|nr:hypothetical protein BSG35_13365 [Vibrio parahaemolyticus]OXE00714.1 hypothetical protein BSG33_03360 [Vibrio parahaemolyticus]